MYGQDIYDECGKTIASVAWYAINYELGDGSKRISTNRQANAEHIVRCVNLHDELVSALREVLPIIQRMQSACESGETLCYDNEHDERDAVEYAAVIERVRAVLAKVDAA